MSFGANGLTLKRLADVKSDIEGGLQTEHGIDNVDLSSDGPFGQLVGLHAEPAALVWELMELVLAAANENGASGTLLDKLYLLLNLIRIGAAPSRTVDADGLTPTTTLTGDPGTDVPAGFVLETSDTGERFLLEDAVTIGDGGTVDAVFASETYGPIFALAGTLTEIPTPLAGLDSATNTVDARLGNLQETDAAFRARRAGLTATVVAATAPAVVAAVLGVPGVTEVREIENRSDAPDLDGRPGHSYELVVIGGADQDILDKIYATKPSGIETVGNVDGVVVDLLDEEQPISFSRPTTIPIYIEVDLEVDGGFPANGVTEVLNAIVAYGQGTLRTGLDVSAFKIIQTIETPGIVALDMRIGIAANPVTDETIAIAKNEIAEIDSTRVDVQRVN